MAGPLSLACLWPQGQVSYTLEAGLHQAGRSLDLGDYVEPARWPQFTYPQTF